MDLSIRRYQECVETLALGAKGAKCESLGHRPRRGHPKIFLALKARNIARGWIMAVFE
jgi:hypothetical protein